MARAPDSLALPRSTLLAGLLLSALCLIAQHGSDFFSAFIELPTRLTRVQDTPWTWKVDLSAIPPGNYYLSVGRPRGPCEIISGSRVLATTKSQIPELRNGLMLGSSFEVGPTHEGPSLEISCEPQQG